MSVFVKKKLFFLIFLDFRHQKYGKILAKLPKNDYLCIVAKQMWKSVDVKVLRCEDVKVFRVFSGILCAVSEHFNTSTS